MKTLYSVSLVALVVVPLAYATPSFAQTEQGSAPMTAKAEADDLSDGVVRKISKDTGKLTIKHGVIKSLDMPPMTMVFTAKDVAMLDKVAVGDKVKFAVIDQGGKMVITDIQPVK